MASAEHRIQETPVEGAPPPHSSEGGDAIEQKRQRLQECRRVWLSCTSDNPDHYELLGIPRFTSDSKVIESATDRAMGHVRTHQNGPDMEATQEILNQVSRAKRCLLNEGRKREYDATLRRGASVAATQLSTAQAAKAAAETKVDKRKPSDTPPDGIKAIAVPMARPATGPVSRDHGAPPLPATKEESPAYRIDTSQESVGDARRNRNLRKKPMSPWVKYGAPAVLAVGAAAVSLAALVGGKKDKPEARPTKPRVAQVVNAEENRVRPPVVVEEPIEAEPTSKEIEQARLEAERKAAAEAEAARLAALPVEPEPGIEPDPDPDPPEPIDPEKVAAAEAAAAAAARDVLNSGISAQYQELRKENSDESAAILLAAASSERNPATRAILAFIAYERAIEEGSIEKMSAAMAIVTTPSTEAGYSGMHPHDALVREEHILDNTNMRGNIKPNERLTLARTLLAKTWDAIEYNDYNLANELVLRGAEVVPTSIATTGMSREERTAFTRAKNVLRGQLNSQRSRIREFATLGQAAENGSVYADAMRDILQRGDWTTALPKFAAQSENSAAAEAAKLELALTAESSADAIITTAERWRAAGRESSQVAGSGNHTPQFYGHGRLVGMRARDAVKAIGGNEELVLQRRLGTVNASANSSVGDNYRMGGQGYVHGKPSEDGPPEPRETEPEVEVVRVVSTWSVSYQDGRNATITLHSDGKVSTEGGTGSWSIREGQITLRWPNQDAPGGAWVDTCTLSRDKRTFVGQNQLGHQIRGSIER